MASSFVDSNDVSDAKSADDGFPDVVVDDDDDELKENVIKRYYFVTDAGPK